MYRVRKFTTQKVYINREGLKKYHVCVARTYEWSDNDCVYYNVDTEEDFYYEVPTNGKKILSLKAHYDARLLVKHIASGTTKF